MSEPIILDNTKRATFHACKKKFFLQHEKGLQSNFGSTALRYGVTWHGIQEGYHKFVKEHGWPEDPVQIAQAMAEGLKLGREKWDKESEKKQYIEDYRNFNTAVDAFTRYLDYTVDDKKFMKVINTEVKFECPIEPENDVEETLLSQLPPVVFTGRIDLCVELDYTKWLFDFKTTGQSIDMAASRANRSPQLIGYSYAGEKVLNFKPGGCLCSFSQVSARKNKDGVYGNTSFDFRRVPQIYTQGDIDAWKLGFIDTCRELQVCRRTNIWPESFDACYQYGACTYLKLCNQHQEFEDLNTENFHVEFWDVISEGDD